MRPLNTNFSGALSARTQLYLVILVVALLAAAVESWAWWQLHQRRQTLHAKIFATAHVAQDRRRARAQQAAPSAPAYIADALALAQGADFDLNQVLAALEGARVPGVRVTSIDAVVERASVTVELELLDMAALTPYMHELRAAEPALGWQIQRLMGSASGSAGVATIGVARRSLSN
jgi:hypothetical protein